MSSVGHRKNWSWLPLSSTETTCATAHHVQLNKYPSCCAIISHLSRDNVSFIARLTTTTITTNKTKQNVACPLWAIVKNDRGSHYRPRKQRTRQPNARDLTSFLFVAQTFFFYRAIIYHLSRDNISFMAR